MDYTPVTPFRRMVSAAQLQHQARARQQDLPETGVNKWEILRELAAARTVFGLSDRDLAVLQALISFHPEPILDPGKGVLIVHPSNAAICERLNGMACSTMRRHLSHLVHAGIILRRDSPNGKRYVRRYGDEKIAYGFDLVPLLQRKSEFCRAATALREARQRDKRLRETVSLMRRDLAALALYGAELRPDLALWTDHADLAEDIARLLRRKLDYSALADLRQALEQALNAARDILEPKETQESSTNESRNEQHYQNSKTDSYDLEPRLKKARAAEVAPQNEDSVICTGERPGISVVQNEQQDDRQLPNVPLGLVLSACSEIHGYSDHPMRHWHDLVTAADTVRPMMGISPSAWDEARRHMGAEEAAVVVSVILDRFTEIRSPGGYLRALTDKAAAGAFSCGPMVMALMRREAA